MRLSVVLFVSLFFGVVCCRAQSPEIERIEGMLSHAPDSVIYVRELNRLALLLYEANIDSTFYYTRWARSIAVRRNDRQGIADALNNLGAVYDIKGNFQLALRYFDEAHTAYLAVGDSGNIVQTLMNIAEVYTEVANAEKAISGYGKALDLGRRLEQDSILSFVIYNTLLSYPVVLGRDSADWWLEKARSIGLKYKDNRMLLALNQLTADKAIQQGDRATGIALLRSAIDSAIASHLYFLSLDLLIDAGDQLAGIDTAMAARYYQEGLRISYAHGYLYYSRVMAKKLYDFYTLHTNNAAALEYGRQLIKLYEAEDQLANSSGVDYIDYALKDQELGAVRLRAKYESVFLCLAVLVCLLAIGILVILWRNGKRMQQTNKALRTQFGQSEATTAALDTMNKNYARLLKVVAHDLRNPMGAVMTIADMLAARSAGSDAELVKLLQVSSQTGIRLINELLETDFDQQQHLVKEALCLDELLEQCVELLRFRARDKRQEIVLTSDDGIRVEVDKEKVARVISNLIVNAIKFSPAGSEIFVGATCGYNRVIITVKDMGIGIPTEMREQIFDPFTAAKRTGTGGERPFGLGLYISKQIVEGHQGKIGFSSQPGVGTEFFVELPMSSAI